MGKKSACMKFLTSLAEVAATEVKKTGKLTIPGVCMVKTRVKPATKAGKRAMAPKAMKAKAMKGAKSLSKGGLAEAVATATDMKKSACMKRPTRWPRSRRPSEQPDASGSAAVEWATHWRRQGRGLLACVFPRPSRGALRPRAPDRVPK